MRYTLCPFYLTHRTRTVRCEDSYRYFEKPKEMGAWMDRYCDDAWESCPYAKGMMEAYAAEERGDTGAVDKVKTESMRKEYVAMLTKLGKAEGRVRDLGKEVHDLEAQNAVLRAKIDDLSEEKAKVDKLLKKEIKSRREANKSLEEVSGKVYAQMQEISHIYEARFCFFLDTFCDGKISEETIKKWAEGKSFALVGDSEEGIGRVWKVLFDAQEGSKDESGSADRKID